MAIDHIEIINLKKRLSAAGIDVTLLQAAVTILQGDMTTAEGDIITLQGQVPPAGGNANDVLTKDTNANYDFSWQAPASSGLTQAQVLARGL